ncbi:MAG: hypothetical protein IJP86_04095 [Synergistaceae bacterium]|nr:hypothetical protein [Synergistaceae bacterium]
MADEDAYIRRDVFEARMDRMEMLLEKTVLEIKSYVDKSTGETRAYVEKSTADTRAYVEKSTADTRAYVEKALTEIKAEIVEVKNDVRVLTARVDSMENVLYWGLGLFGIILALSTMLPTILEYTRKLFKLTPTLEDMERVAETVSEKVAERVANAVIERHLSGGK